MPRRKTSARKLEKFELKENRFLKKFQISESYISLVLGIIVVAFIFVVVILFFKGKNILNFSQPAQETSSTKTQNLLENGSRSTYTVVSGDTLWSISEKEYNSGYNWVDIANANKLSNPDIIESGTKLIIPKVETKQVEPSATPTPTKAIQMFVIDSITGSSYTIKTGDDLWNIAVRAYGDGYAWVKIAQANKLENPDLIHSGNTLVIPR
ncbi:MAG: LysM peptidoglycan-binding domain-containing protein [Candidatus Levyibacteriota bacterium]